jgi:hypothetical protein
MVHGRVAQMVGSGRSWMGAKLEVSVVVNLAAQRNLFPQPSDTKEQLVERVKANLRIPRQ